jgi:hypothetical protein
VVSGKGIDVETNTKPAIFGQNMGGNRTGTTIDTHAIRGILQTLNQIDPGGVPDGFILPKFREAYKADPSTLTPNMIDDTLAKQVATKTKGVKGKNVQTEYSVFADIMHDAAAELGVSPAEAQSMAWFGLGGETNLGSELKTVADVFDERLAVTAQALGISVEDAARLVYRRQSPLLAGGVPTGLFDTDRDERAKRSDGLL